VSAATEALERSRERLRQALLANAPPPPAAKQRAGGNSGSAWFGTLADMPALQSLRRMWDEHPLRAVLQLSGEAADAALQPLAQRRPVALLLGSALTGAALVWSRPWRWLLTPALVAGLLPRLLKGAVVGVPAAGWMTLAGTLARGAPARRHGAGRALDAGVQAPTNSSKKA